MDNPDRKKLLSITIPSFQSESRIDNAVEVISNRMKFEKIPFEIIIIDDGSTDNSFSKALALEKRFDFVRAYQLSRNYTSPYVQFAGFQLAKGSCSITIPDDLQRPLDVAVRMYREWEKGAKIVIAHHDNRSDGFFSDLFSNAYYKIMNSFSDITFPPGGADGFLADREVIDLLNKQISPRNTTPTIEALRLGFEPVFFPYTRPKASHKSRWTLRKKVKLASDSFFSSSNFPIRFITTIGFITALFSFFLIVAIIVAKLFSDNSLFGFPIQGWATIVVLISFFNGLVLFCLGIVAAYIWRIYEEVKRRPGFIIREKSNNE
jgi:dolichol-phosphate mannosyltransferase